MSKKAKKIVVCKSIDDVDKLLEDFYSGDGVAEVEVHVEKGILSARRVETTDYITLGDVSRLDMDEVEAAISRYLRTDGSDIASMACAIHEDAKTIESMALGLYWDDCEACALDILATAHKMLVELRHKRAEE